MVSEGRPIGRKYEWRDTVHGPQLWNLDEDCWALWYGIGAIGISDETKAEIDAALNPTWGAADEALAAARSEVDELRRKLEYERDPSGVLIRGGHHRRCAKVRYPHALYPCSCAMEITRAHYVLDLYAAGKCTTEAGSADRCKDQKHPWLPPGRHYCEGSLSSSAHDGRRVCETCGSARYPDVDEEWRSYEEDLIAATTAHLPECSICRRRHGAEVEHACE